MENNEFGHIKEGKVYRNTFLDFPEKEIGEVKESEEEAIQYFSDRFKLAQEQVAKVKEKIEATQNKGSYLMKVLHLKETLHDFDALGDFKSLYEELNVLHSQLQANIDANRHKNLQIKTALLEELKQVAESTQWKSATTAVKEIQHKWIKTGAVPDDQKEQVESNFKTIIDAFYERRSAFYKDLEQMMVEKEESFKDFLKQKEEAFAKIKQFTDLRAAIDSSISEWKELGKIKPDKHSAFWNDFQSIIKKNQTRIKKLSKVSKEDTKAILKKASTIIEKLESEASLIESKLDITSIQKEWKSLGRFSDKELHDKYKELTEVISEKKFLASLVARKAKKGADAGSLNSLRVKLLRELLTRDVKELNTFEENLGKFNTSKGLDDMISGKLNRQKRKVEVKKQILKELRASK